MALSYLDAPGHVVTFKDYERWYAEWKKVYPAGTLDTLIKCWEAYKKIAPRLGITIKESPTEEVSPEWGEVCP